MIREPPSARIEPALDRALDAGDPAPFYDLLARNSKLPGPRANLELARAIGVAIAARRRRADGLVRDLAGAEEPFGRIVSAMALAERSVAGVDEKGALAALQALAEDERGVVREGIIAALRVRIDARGEAAVAELAAWTDGFLQAAIVIEALADKNLLARLPDAAGEALVARLDEAFERILDAPRSAERGAGLRLLSARIPEAAARFAARFPQALDWIAAKTATARPAGRAIVSASIEALRAQGLARAEVERLVGAFRGSAPAPRDPSRIVAGTRKRGRTRAGR